VAACAVTMSWKRCGILLSFPLRNGESQMPKAILKNGHIHPLEPLPADWTEGQELDVEPSQTRPDAELSPADIDRDFQELEALCALGDPAEDERLARLLKEAHHQAKEQVRRQMGLSL
jgi:hypothetical protein